MGHNGTLIHTICGGKYWYYQDIGSGADLNSLMMFDNQRGLAVGNHGVIVNIVPAQ